MIRCLLIVPFPESSLNQEAGKLFMEDYNEYFKIAKLFSDIHARRTDLANKTPVEPQKKIDSINLPKENNINSFSFNLFSDKKIKIKNNFNEISDNKDISFGDIVNKYIYDDNTDSNLTGSFNNPQQNLLNEINYPDKENTNTKKNSNFHNEGINNYNNIINIEDLKQHNCRNSKANIIKDYNYLSTTPINKYSLFQKKYSLTNFNKDFYRNEDFFLNNGTSTILSNQINEKIAEEIEKSKSKPSLINLPLMKSNFSFNDPSAVNKSNNPFVYKTPNKSNKAEIKKWLSKI